MVRPFNAAMEREWQRSILVQPIRKKSLSAVIGKFKGGSLRYGKKGKWIRLTGEAVIDDTVEARKQCLKQIRL